jgi:hypothetical protein
MATKKQTGENNLQIKKDICFVIMPFSREWSDEYYEELYCSAILKAGLEPHRADDLFAPNTVVEDIWNYTKKAKIILADLTGKNPNVFYELGLAHAIAKPVILITEFEEDIPFDLRAIRIIKYNKNNHNWGETLKKSITQAIKEIIENPENSIPPTFLRTSKESKGVVVSSTEKEILELKNDIELLKKEVHSRALSRIDRPSANSARVQIRDYIRHGLSDESITNRMLRLGVPASWLERELQEARREQN